MASPSEVITAPSRGFWADAFHSFVVPFEGRGPFVLVVVLVLQLCAAVAGVVPFLGGLVGVIVTGWLCALFLNIISETCRGEDELPQVTMENGVMEDIALPLFRFVGSYLWVFLPLIAFILIIWRLGISPAPGIVAGLFAFGVFIWPMTALTIAIHGFTLDALRYDLQLLTIGRAFLPYLAIWGLLLLTMLGLLAAKFSGRLVTQFPGIFGWLAGLGYGLIVANLLNTYLMLVAMRIIGLFYRHFKRHFAWVAE